MRRRRKSDKEEENTFKKEEDKEKDVWVEVVGIAGLLSMLSCFEIGDKQDDVGVKEEKEQEERKTMGWSCQPMGKKTRGSFTMPWRCSKGRS